MLQCRPSFISGRDGWKQEGRGAGTACCGRRRCAGFPPGRGHAPTPPTLRAHRGQQPASQPASQPATVVGTAAVHLRPWACPSGGKARPDLGERNTKKKESPHLGEGHSQVDGDVGGPLARGGDVPARLHREVVAVGDVHLDLAGLKHEVRATVELVALGLVAQRLWHRGWGRREGGRGVARPQQVAALRCWGVCAQDADCLEGMCTERPRCCPAVLQARPAPPTPRHPASQTHRAGPYRLLHLGHKLEVTNIPAHTHTHTRTGSPVQGHRPLVRPAVPQLGVCRRQGVAGSRDPTGQALGMQPRDKGAGRKRCPTASRLTPPPHGAAPPQPQAHPTTTRRCTTTASTLTRPPRGAARATARCWCPPATSQSPQRSRSGRTRSGTRTAQACRAGRTPAGGGEGLGVQGTRTAQACRAGRTPAGGGRV